MSKAVVEEILARDLVSQTARVGVALYSELERLAAKYPQLVRNLRGKGQG